MYVVTFYSFKGGVGRTMALVNVGVELANSGRRVLMVDFDLEAPGLGTFNLHKPMTPVSGLVEYVTQYMDTGKAPNVMDFMYEASGMIKDTGRLWVMPAGREDDTYAVRLASIDWQKLYSEYDGYLMFEDLKEQWKQRLQPDYVLVDSRTGHTDEAGICTRQLPDAVSILFFPNEQNLQGLRKVVSDVRKEALEPRKKNIQLHFVTSNVPDIDDEDQILESRMQRFRDSLGYQELSAIIHHYNSLALLNQIVFTADRRRSRLAHEYRRLVRAIIRHNPEDREGVLDFLTRILRQRQRFTRELQMTPSDLEARLDTIRVSHAHDGEVLSSLAAVREQQGRLEEAATILTDAVEDGFTNASVLARLANLNWLTSDHDAAVDAIKKILNSKESTYFEVDLSARILRQIDPQLLGLLQDSIAFSMLEPEGQLIVMDELFWNRESLQIAEPMIKGLASKGSLSEDENKKISNMLTLSYIGSGRFKDAMHNISAVRPKPGSLKTYEAFNYAMAEWGHLGLPPVDLFQSALMTMEGGNPPQTPLITCNA